jgi:hypothetical protein
LKKYVSFVEMIKMHCNDTKCVLNYIISIFTQSQKEIYDPIIERFDNISKEEYSIILENSIYEI